MRAGFKARRAGGRIEGTAIVVAYGWVWRAVMLIAMLGLAGLQFAARRGGAPSWVMWFFLCAFLMSAFGVVEMFLTTYRIEPEQLARRSAWQRQMTIPWQAIAKVRWREASKTIRVDAADGKRVSVSLMMSGVGSLARKLVETVPASAFDSETYANLQVLCREAG